MSHHLHNCVSHKMSLQSLLSVMNHFIHVIDMYGSIFVVETASLDISIVRSYELMNVTYRTSGHECQLNTILHKCSVILPRSSSVCVTLLIFQIAGPAWRCSAVLPAIVRVILKSQAGPSKTSQHTSPVSGIFRKGHRPECTQPILSRSSSSGQTQGRATQTRRLKL